MTVCTKLAKQITDFAAKNKKMPILLEIDGVGYNQNHMAYRLAYGVCNDLKDAKPFHIDNAKQPKGNKLNHKFIVVVIHDLLKNMWLMLKNINKHLTIWLGKVKI